MVLHSIHIALPKFLVFPHPQLDASAQPSQHDEISRPAVNDKGKELRSGVTRKLLYGKAQSKNVVSRITLAENGFTFGPSTRDVKAGENEMAGAPQSQAFPNRSNPVARSRNSHRENRVNAVTLIRPDRGDVDAVKPRRRPLPTIETVATKEARYPDAAPVDDNRIQQMRFLTPRARGIRSRVSAVPARPKDSNRVWIAVKGQRRSVSSLSDYASRGQMDLEGDEMSKPIDRPYSRHFDFVMLKEAADCHNDMTEMSGRGQGHRGNRSETPYEVSERRGGNELPGVVAEGPAAPSAIDNESGSGVGLVPSHCKVPTLIWHAATGRAQRGSVNASPAPFNAASSGIQHMGLGLLDATDLPQLSPVKILSGAVPFNVVRDSTGLPQSYTSKTHEVPTGRVRRDAKEIEVQDTGLGAISSKTEGRRQMGMGRGHRGRVINFGHAALEMSLREIAVEQAGLDAEFYK
jgi:hypothetical protein